MLYVRSLAVLVLAAAACLLLAPGAAHGQAIGGTVTDTTGGVLPGVTVEARSPALIEQVRTAVTDGNGQYLIVALETGRLFRDLHPAGLQHRRARGGWI